MFLILSSCIKQIVTLDLQTIVHKNAEKEKRKVKSKQEPEYVVRDRLCTAQRAQDGRDLRKRKRKRKHKRMARRLESPESLLFFKYQIVLNNKSGLNGG